MHNLTEFAPGSQHKKAKTKCQFSSKSYFDKTQYYRHSNRLEVRTLIFFVSKKRLVSENHFFFQLNNHIVVFYSTRRISVFNFQFFFFFSEPEPMEEEEVRQEFVDVNCLCVNQTSSSNQFS